MEADKYCTSCGTKYPWYEEECPDCHLRLSPLPADQMPDPDAELVSVLRTTERGLLPAARARLEEQGVEFTVEDRGFSEQILGRRSSATVGETVEPFSILVRAEDVSRARQVLDDLRRPSEPEPVLPTLPAARPIKEPFGRGTPEAQPSVDLHDAATGTYIGSLTTEQFEELSTCLERESTTDDDYYIDGSTLDLLSDTPLDPRVVQTLRSALGSRPGMDVRWTRRTDTALS